MQRRNAIHSVDLQTLLIPIFQVFFPKALAHQARLFLSYLQEIPVLQTVNVLDLAVHQFFMLVHSH